MDNDIRAAIGSLVHAVSDIKAELSALRERVDQLAPAAGAVRRLDQLAGDLDAVVALVPDAMRQAATQPPLSLMVGDRLHDLADQIETTLAERRAVPAELVAVGGA